MNWLVDFKPLKFKINLIYENEECIIGEESAITNKYDELPGLINENIRIDAATTIQDFKIIIENSCKIPTIYQCLFFNGKVLGHTIKNVLLNESVFQSDFEPETMKENKSQLVVLDQSYDVLMSIIDNEENKVNLYSLSGFVATYTEEILALSETNIESVYNSFIIKYWPFCTLEQFKRLYQGYAQSSMTYDLIDPIVEIKSINLKTIQNLLKPSQPMLVKQSHITKYQGKLPLEIIFDQLKYPCIAKFDNKYIYLKYNNETKRFSEDDIQTIKKTNDPQIFIPMLKARITRSGTLNYESLKTRKEIEEIIENIGFNLVELQTKSSFRYNITFNNPIMFDMKQFESFARQWEPLFIRDETIYVPAGSFELLYNPTSAEIQDKRIYSTFERTSIRFNQSNITISGIRDFSMIKYLYNISLRMIVLFIHNTSILAKNVKQRINLANIDPVLYRYSTQHFKPHSRLCQKVKQPIAFLDQRHVEQFLKDNPEISAKKSVLTQQNYTYPDLITTYICSNPKYPYPTLISAQYHPLKYRMVCCTAIRHNTIQDEPKVNISNMYYVRKYSSSKPLAINKLSHLPQYLNSMLNSYKCRLKTNAIVEKSKCYFLMKFSKPLNQTTNVIRLIEKNGNIKLDERFDRTTIIENLRTKKMIFLLSNESGEYIIINLSLPKAKHYVITYEHEPNSIISKEFIKIFEKLIIRQSVNEKHPSAQDLESANIDFIQINSKLISEVLIEGNILFPISQSLPLSSKPIISSNEFQFPESKQIIKTIEMINNKLPSFDLKIKNQLIDDNGYAIGFRLTNNIVIRFKPIKSLTDWPKEYIHLDFSNDTKKENNVSRDFEQYNMLLLHFAEHLNVDDDAKKKLLKLTDEESIYTFCEEFIQRFIKIDIKADQKQMLTGTNIRFLCSHNQNTEKTLTYMCKGTNMLLTKTKLDKFLKLLTFELTYNSLRRYMILENKLSRIINPYQFSKIEGFTITRETL